MPKDRYKFYKRNPKLRLIELKKFRDVLSRILFLEFLFVKKFIIMIILIKSKEGILKKVGFLGPKGTFSDEAHRIYYKDKEIEPIEYMTINDAIFALEKEEIQEAIVPIENSLEGSVSATLDMISTSDLNIISEIIIPIKLNLMARIGVKKQEIKTIYTHPQPVGQCRNYLTKNFNNVNIAYTDSTTLGAKLVLESKDICGAIGAQNMAQIYGIEILEYNISDNDNNETRFIVLSKGTIKRTGSDKTSIVFSSEDKPGSLYKILDIFSLWDINLTKIESRPSKEKLGQYIFFADMEGHIEDQDVLDALTMIQRKTSFYKFLGSYPKYV